MSAPKRTDTAPQFWNVTPSDKPMTRGMARMFRVEDTGTVVLKDETGATCTFTITAAPDHIYAASDTVMATGTTCEDIIAYA